MWRSRYHKIICSFKKRQCPFNCVLLIFGKRSVLKIKRCVAALLRETHLRGRPRKNEKRNFPPSLAKVSQSIAKAENVFFASLSATLAELCGILLTHLAKNAQEFSKQGTNR